MISLRTQVLFVLAILMSLPFAILVSQEAEWCRRPQVWPWVLMAKGADTAPVTAGMSVCPFDDPSNVPQAVVVLSWLYLTGGFLLSGFMDLARRVVGGAESAGDEDDGLLEEPAYTPEPVQPAFLSPTRVRLLKQHGHS